jgi:hypothetical protein
MLTHFLGEEVDVRLVAAMGCIKELDEGEGLSGRGDGNDKRRQTGTAHIDEAALGQEDDPLAVRPDHVVHLRAHLFPRQIRGSKTIL